MKIKKLYESIIYENPVPVLRSRHSFFPFACELNNGDLYATHMIAEAFESVDGTTRISISRDKGKSWELLSPFYDKSSHRIPVTDVYKITNIGDGKLVLFGYEIIRENPELSMSNPETGGVLDSRMAIMRSNDNGLTWSFPEEVFCRWGSHVEASAPITVLANGDWITPITAFPKWDGTFSGKLCGRLLRSSDSGKTWNDDSIIMDMGDCITTYEQRLCILKKSGTIVCIAWNENLVNGVRLNNHYAVSYDNGKNFEGPFNTGILAQSSSVCAIGDEKLLSLHAKRRDTDKPGVYAYIVNLENRKWEIESETIIWEPDFPSDKDEKMAEVFSSLKFGQPGAILLSDGTVLTTQWVIKYNQGKTICIRLKLA